MSTVRDQIRAKLLADPGALEKAEKLRDAMVSAGRPLPDTTYQKDPVGWARDVLGIPEHTIVWSLNEGYASHKWDGTPDPLAVIARALAAGQDVGVESGTGTGKTFEGAWIAAWFLCCFEQSIVVTTAPKEDQLTLHIWKEIGDLVPRLKKQYPTLSVAHLRLRARPVGVEDDEDWSKEKWAVIGYACGVDAATSEKGSKGAASRAKGFHATHMLIITEETQGVNPSVMTSLENTCTGDHNLRLAFGNPEHQLDALHQFCVSPGVVHVIASGLDHPNVVTGREVVPGAVGRKSVNTRLAKYGEGSPLYNAQVRGLSPKEAPNALIKLEWLEAAAARFTDPRFRVGGKAKGVDVAQSEAGDKAAIADWIGACLLPVRSFQCPNATLLGEQVWAEALEEAVAPMYIGFDPVGVGAATANALFARSNEVQALNGGALPIEYASRAPDGSTMDWIDDLNKFSNLRTQMWWQFREDLRLERIAIPYDLEFFRQCIMPKFEVKNGKVVLEPKLLIKARLNGMSPDDAEAAIYGNWVRPRAKIPEKAPVADSVLQDPTVFLPLDTGDYGYEPVGGGGPMSQFSQGY